MSSIRASACSSISARTRAQTVSQTILTKVVGEVGAAQPGSAQQYCITISDETDPVFPAGTCIDFHNRSGSGVYITAIDGALCIHYRPINSGGQRLDAVDWAYDAAVYNGFRIESLTFAIVPFDTLPAGHSNVLSVTMVLADTRSDYTYEATRYVQCYNYESVDIGNISTGVIPPDV